MIQMTQTIWQVKVYEDDRTNYTLYHFDTKQNVEASIATTWSNVRGSIKKQNTDEDCILIVDALDQSKVLLIAEPIEFDLLTKPTHF